MDIIGASLKGIYRDVLKSKDGRVLYDSGWNSNTIVDNCRVLLAAFICNDTAEEAINAQGIIHLAVGQGDPNWDGGSIPKVEPTETYELEDSEHAYICKDEDLNIAYIKEENGLIVHSGPPTNWLEIEATLGENKPSDTEIYPLREFGLFGQLGDQPYMINCIRHQLIHKRPEDTLIRKIRLQF